MRGKPERRLYLDIKNVDLDQLAAEVRKHEVAGQIIFATTDYDLIRRWKTPGAGVADAALDGRQ